MVLSARSFLLLAAYLAVRLDANVLPGQLPVPTSTSGCITMTPDILRYCSYNRTCTTLPNVKGHNTLQEAWLEFQDFILLIDRTRCSPLLQLFLCFYYFPIDPPANLGRSAAISAHQFLPCRSVCESVRDSCEPSIMRYRPEVGGWPGHLNCSQFPDDSTTSSCIKPATPPSTTTTPPSTTAPPPSTTATPPSTTATPPNTTAPPPSTTATPPSTTATPPRTTATPPSTTAPPTQPPTMPTTTLAPTTDNSGGSSGSGEMPPTNATSNTTASPPLVCIQPETDQSKTCSCAKVRPNISKRTLKKGLYSFVAKVKILSNTTLSIQRGRNLIDVMGYRARIEENFPVSCSTSRLQAGKEIILETDMSPDCLCAIIEDNHEYIVAGYSTTKVDVMHIPTDKRYKSGSNGGCVFGCWQSRYRSRINGYLETERPLNNCHIYL